MQNRDEMIDENLSRPSQEFVETAQYLLDEIDQRVPEVETGADDAQDTLHYIRLQLFKASSYDPNSRNLQTVNRS